MISKEHKKHTALTRPAYGNFSRNEWAIVGTHCNTIKSLVDDIIAALSDSYQCAYIDAQHQEEVNQLSGRLAKGAALEYIDQINFAQFNFKKTFNQFQYRQQFAEMDMVLVNGNHHQAKAQVVVIDSSKKASLQKRLEQLTNVQLILLAEGESEIVDFIKIALPDQIPVYRISELDKIIAFFKDQLKKAAPLLNGLVLAGGKSIRMGEDKGTINWHGKEQRYYIADILKPHCQDVYISCRSDQEISSDYPVLKDTFADLGPFGAILSAFREQPDRAWLVVACDLPLLETATLQYLIANRKIAALATAFQSNHDDFPEPLITIWEPKSYPALLSFLAQGYSCPRKVLINSNINLLKAPYPQELTNVNTPDDLQQVKQLLQSKTTA